MKSHLSDDFISLFRRLPLRIQQLARRNYRLWRENPAHRSLQFKLVGRRKPVYSVRVGTGWRALGVKIGNTIVWFWIGSHAEYDRIIRKM